MKFCKLLPQCARPSNCHVIQCSTSACLIGSVLGWYGPLRVRALRKLGGDTWWYWWCFGCLSHPKPWGYGQRTLFIWGNIDWWNNSTVSAEEHGPWWMPHFEARWFYYNGSYWLWIVTLLRSEPGQNEWKPTLFQREVSPQCYGYPSNWNT